MARMKYYNLKTIVEYGAQYNIIIGERSNGKTYSVLDLILTNYWKRGEQGGIVRRWEDDLRGKRGATMFDALVSNGRISKLTGGKYNGVVYKSFRWYLKYHDNEKNLDVIDDTPFCYGFALSTMEHDKSTSYPNITTIMFDEFLTRKMYLADEFVIFCNVISTIIRHRNNVKIFMLGNTVNKYCPYFSEMGLTNVQNMKQGTIDIYNYGDSDLKVAVEYTASLNKSKPSDIYFAFNNPKLHMITGGTWEIALYPHCPCKYRPNEIRFVFFIKFNGDLLQCEVVQHENMKFIFIHRKTTEIQNPDTDLIYQTEYDARPNYSRKINKPRNNKEKAIAQLFATDKVFYQNNEIGEIVRNYLNWCATAKIV